MMVITGITGRVGGHVARRLLAEGHAVRAVLRDEAKAQRWRDAGCEIAVADMSDQAALASAFHAAESVFVLLPPDFDPAPGFAQSRAIVEAVLGALVEARPRRVVALSTIGAQAEHENLLTQLRYLESRLSTLQMPVAFLRAAWFIENAGNDVVAAREDGVIDSFLQPVDRRVPMVATRDVGAEAARLMAGTFTGHQVVELEGPAPVSPAEIASLLGELLGKKVWVRSLPRASWESRFRAQGMCNPTPRMRMLDGFNEGWIAFEGDGATIRRGVTPLRTVLGELVSQQAA